MENVILGIVLLAVVGSAIMYIVKEKKRGVRCIGCPNAGVCAQKNGKNGCTCHKDTE